MATGNELASSSLIQAGAWHQLLHDPEILRLLNREGNANLERIGNLLDWVNFLDNPHLGFSLMHYYNTLSSKLSTVLDESSKYARFNQLAFLQYIYVLDNVSLDSKPDENIPWPYIESRRGPYSKLPVTTARLGAQMAFTSRYFSPSGLTAFYELKAAKKFASADGQLEPTVAFKPEILEFAMINKLWSITILSEQARIARTITDVDNYTDPYNPFAIEINAQAWLPKNRADMIEIADTEDLLKVRLGRLKTFMKGVKAGTVPHLPFAADQMDWGLIKDFFVATLGFKNKEV